VRGGRVGASASYPEGMDSIAPEEEADLLSTLEVIEAQPLSTRAEAYEGVHDTLARRLESGPAGASPHA
jgi:hypothetical protein